MKRQRISKCRITILPFHYKATTYLTVRSSNGEIDLKKLAKQSHLTSGSMAKHVRRKKLGNEAWKLAKLPDVPRSRPGCCFLVTGFHLPRCAKLTLIVFLFHIIPAAFLLQLTMTSSMSFRLESRLSQGDSALIWPAHPFFTGSITNEFM